MHVRLASLLTLVVLAIPSAALAQEPGVHVDPDSPSAKEYAIPLDQARGSLAPAGPTSAAQGAVARHVRTGSGKAHSPSSEPVLFGAGVTPASTKASTSQSAALVAVKAAGTSSSGGGIPPWLLALGVVLAGGGIGLLVRAIRRSKTT